MAAGVQAILQIARIKDPESRGRLALGVAQLCAAKPLSGKAEPLAGEVLLMLTERAEDRVRLAIAEALADCAWAPHDVIRFLAFDAIDIARPVIARSLRLTEADLIALAHDGSPGHREALAERPGLSQAVTDALVAIVEPRVIRALAANDTAALGRTAYEICVDSACEDVALSERLARRTDLPEHLAERLCVAVGEAVRETLIERFGLDRAAIEAVVIGASEHAMAEDEDALAARLIAKMERSGQLNGSYALRALTQGRDAVFDHAIASLCGVKTEQWRSALAVSGVRSAALACRAARIDKSVFPTIHRALHRSGRVHALLEGEALEAAAKVFQMYTPGKACDSLRRLADTV